jgi:PAS domain S-box-containing protein/putative nucleotidyltransferase with HDIG domain
MPGTPLSLSDAHALLALMPGAVCVLDGNGRVVWANPGWESVVGQQPPAPGEAGFLASLCAGPGSPLGKSLARCLAGKPVEPVVVQRLCDSDIPVWIEWRLAAAGEGRLVAWGRDVSMERRSGDALGELRLLEDEAERYAGLGSWRLDLSDGSLVWSPEMYRIFGVDPSTDLDLAAVTAGAIHPDDRAMIEEINRSVLADHEPRPARYRILLPDGAVRWVYAQGHQAFDDSGRAVALVGFVQDITDRVLAEEALHVSETRYRAIIDGMQDAYFRADLEGNLILANQAAALMYGFGSPAEMVGVPAASLYADPDERDDVIEQLRREGIVADRLGRARRIDGSTFWVSLNVSLAWDESGAAIGTEGFARDVTARVLAEKSLAASERFSQRVLDTSPNLIYIYDLVESRNIYTNREVTDFLGYSSEEVLAFGSALFENILHPDDGPKVGAHHDSLRRLAPGDDSVLEVDYRMRRVDGEWRWLHSRDIPFARDASGAVTQILGSTEDVTPAREAAQRLLDSETKFRTVAEFTYDWEMWNAPDGTALYVSPSCEKSTGYTNDRFMSERGLFESIVHPDDLKVVGGHLGVAGDPAPCPIVFRVIRRDGGTRWIEHVCEAVHDEQGTDLGRRASNRDVTDRVLAEHAQSESLSLLRATLESTADGILVVDRVGKIASYNRRFAELWDAPAPMLEAGDDAALIAFVAGQLADPPTFVGQIGHLYDHPELEAFDVLDFADGRVYERYSRPQLIGDEIVGRVWSFRDVTKRATAERALRESEESLREAQAIARLGSFVYDIPTQRWTSSETMDDIIGIDASYVRDLNGWMALIHEDDRDKMAAYLADDVLTRHLPFDMPYRATRHDDGRTVWVHGHGRLEMDGDGRPARIVGAVQDVTSLHRDQEALRQTNESLERMVYEVAEAMGRVIEIRDQYTKGHQERTARVAKAIALEMKLPKYDVTAVEMAAAVHDIGKLSVPAEILTRPTHLSELEMALIREHPRNGYEILKDLPFPWPVAEIVLEHHERMDGSGYPSGLRGDAIVPLARVLTVADVVEAMATHRPYRPALGLKAAFAELRDNPEKYDKAVVDACARVYKRGELDL